MEAYLHGVSTRKVDDLVKALGADTGISKSVWGARTRAWVADQR
jgi:transposase-like protein